MNKHIVHDALILTAFTLVLGLILGIVYGVTKPRIDAEKLKTAQAAYQQVFSDAESFETYEYDQTQADKILQDAEYKDVINDIQSALSKDGEVLGYVITVTAKDGSQGSITFSVGIRNDGTVNGYSITDIAETPGLGMKAQDESFYKQFENKLVEKFTVVKQTPAADNEIEAITGSTITSKAMANGCNAALEYFKTVLQTEGGAQ
ncbi:MAG: RnfABCDGE type electron transport complex subunit G [Agathobacter sp.]|nr:RnfABCDGE type electron transport complex subunit G [Agathobacter sp.]